jgi:hypothetical protein
MVRTYSFGNVTSVYARICGIKAGMIVDYSGDLHGSRSFVAIVNNNRCPNIEGYSRLT